MARALRREPDCNVLGLVPVEQNVGVIAAALQLGVAVHHLTARNVTVVDCNTTAPAWVGCLGDEKKLVDAEVVPGVWAIGQLRPTPSVDLAWCSDVIGERLGVGHFVLCDLTGLLEVGTLGRFFPYVNGLVSVVCAGATLEWRLTAVHQQFPKHLDRGVLFIE